MREQGDPKRLDAVYAANDSATERKSSLAWVSFRRTQYLLAGERAQRGALPNVWRLSEEHNRS
jgi:hypothetical protein